MSILKKDTKDLVYDYIKEKILRLEYNSGDIINITHLTNELSVSNTPIREAISKLVSEGLIIASGTKYRVVSFSEESLSALNEACLVLLTGALQICQKRGVLDVLTKKLHLVLEQQIQAATSASDDAYTAITLAFDRCFMEMSQNECLLHIFDTQTNLLSLSITHSNALSRQNNIAQHKEILSALETGDIEKTTALLTQHFDKHLQDISTHQ